ncbi:hypothetical protein [Streptomyces sp. Wh19]|uniref:hypothetical protein n=1 Tax=Streptomyces sp. Wh19 TaxID=3076629 RepID=UPI0029584698|nr:hypothetical protein [Streptomyces sp. Wh19]MDV9198914.1 hypothetical protein [Streptomyces sp. Wh19]
MVFELAGSLGGTLMAAVVFGGLQTAAPEGQVAQTMALGSTFLQVAALAGAPLGGMLGSYLGLRHTLGIALVLAVVSLAPQNLRWALARWSVDSPKRDAT